MIAIIHYVSFAALGIVCAVATYTDLKTRRIPNWLTVPAIVAGFAINVIADGGPGALAALATVALCGGVFLVLFLLGGMGAGDVKLMAAVAAIGSWPLGAYALMYAALAGGILAVGTLLLRGSLGKTIKRMARLKTYRDAKAAADSEEETLSGRSDLADADAERIYIPYGPAIAAGTVAAMILS